MPKRILALFISVCLLAGLLAACGAPELELPFVGHTPDDSLTPVSAEAGENVLRAALLYDGAAGDGPWEDLWSRLSQPMLLNFEAELVDISQEGWSLEGYALCYPDESVITAANSGDARTALTDFVRAGGGLFLTGGFYEFFHRDVIGAKRMEAIGALPEALDCPEVGADMEELQSVVSDFFGFYKDYEDIEELSALDYGYGVVPSTAVPLALSGEAAVASVNRCGDGWVFYGCALLPNFYAVCGTELISRDENQTALSETTMSFDRLLENAFAAFMAKKTWGFALWRVFGSFGTPSLAWEMSIEDSDTVSGNGAEEFLALCRENGEMPSYSLARGIYTYGLRAESVTYLAGTSKTGLTYKMDTDEGMYSSGTHIAAGGEWLSLSSVKDGRSYFDDANYGQRAYPAVCDYNGDGNADIISGSSDGRFYLFMGRGVQNGKLTVSSAETLEDTRGEALSVSGYSAPCLFDVDGDGNTDIVSGCEDGDIYWFAGRDNGEYESMGKLLDTELTGQSLPDIGELDGDGFPDLVVGSAEGRLLLFRGTPSGTGFSPRAEEIEVFGVSGDWLSPRVFDLDGDGLRDIAVGTASGYVARLIADSDGGFAAGGYIETDEMNMDGNYAAKFGSNCVPFFHDINGDGCTDLICGSLEYGLAYPVTSRYFPLAAALRRQVNALSAAQCYIGVHFFTGEYASPAREESELASHIAALRVSYSASRGLLGASRHTLYGSTLDFSQTFFSAWKKGLLWYSGAPESGRGAFSIPWYLTDGGERTILLQNRVEPDYKEGGSMEKYARYDLPLLLAFEGEEDAVPAVSELRKANGYSCVREDQLLLSAAAAYNMDISLAGSGEAGLSLTLTAGSGISRSAPLYNAAYQSCCGARLSLGEAFADASLAVEANVWHRDGNDIYVSLDAPARIYESETAPTGAHLVDVNVPARLTFGEDGTITAAFLEGGMMQLTVLGEAEAKTPGWQRTERDGYVTFTKYGGASTFVGSLVG